MKNKLISFSIFLLFISSFVNAGEASLTQEKTYDVSSLSNNFDTNLTVYVRFLGFDQDIIDEEAIEDKLPSYFTKWDVNYGTTQLNFNYDFEHLDDMYVNSLRNYILSNSINGTGVGFSLNITKLNEDIISGERTNVFLPEDHSDE